MSDDIQYRIAKMNLEAGDVLVVKANCHLSKQQVQYLSDFMKEKLPEVRALVLDQALELSILTGDELKRRLLAQ